MCRPVILKATVKRSDDDMAATHSDGAYDEESLSAEIVQEQDRWQREDDLKNASDASSQQILERRL